MSAPTRPALRWHGGKWRIAPWIIDHFPPHRVYVEPYGGAGSVLLRKPRALSEIYNDLDGEVVNLFRVLRDRAQAAQLQRLLKLTPFARAELEYAFKSPPPLSQMVERARLLVVKSGMGHGGISGLVRTSPGFRKSRSDKAPPSQDWVNYRLAMDQLVDRLQGVVVECRPALQLLQEVDAKDALHYVDPPYLQSTRVRRYDKVYAHEMTEADHVRLSGVLRGLQGMVVLSGYSSTLYNRLYRGWETRTVAAFGEKATKRLEVLWLNPAAARRQPRRML